MASSGGDDRGNEKVDNATDQNAACSHKDINVFSQVSKYFFRFVGTHIMLCVCVCVCYLLTYSSVLIQLVTVICGCVNTGVHVLVNSHETRKINACQKVDKSAGQLRLPHITSY